MYQVENNPYIQQGWQCPKCLRINAPWVLQCPCSNKTFTYTYVWDGSTGGQEQTGGGGCQCT